MLWTLAWFTSLPTGRYIDAEVVAEGNAPRELPWGGFAEEQERLSLDSSGLFYFRTDENCAI